MDMKQLRSQLQEMKKDILKEIKDQITAVAREELKELLDTSLDNHEQKLIEKLFSAVEECKSSVEDCRIEVEDVKRSQAFINTQFERQAAETKRLNSLCHELQRELREAKKNLDSELDELQQYSRKECLEFHGVPVMKNENTTAIIIELGKLMNISLKQDDISISHRLAHQADPNTTELRKRPPAIIAKFTRRSVRDQLYKARVGLKKFKTFPYDGMKYLFINESLTKHRKSLWKATREKREKSGYKYAWTNGAKIFVRKADKAKALQIRSPEDLNKMV